jgi:hypothetical protein
MLFPHLHHHVSHTFPSGVTIKGNRVKLCDNDTKNRGGEKGDLEAGNEQLIEKEIPFSTKYENFFTKRLREAVTAVTVVLNSK